ncbi:hypothetical protein evm_008805 [Chilo suppressalis]|nr:hypothetical protein evm_008805 [Chilo suppressalis]
MNKFLIFLLAFVAVASALEKRCEEPIERGLCYAYFPRFGYNKEINKCEFFVYGGCQGNDNRFITAEECEKVCQRK